jgi:hypothetical protein
VTIRRRHALAASIAILCTAAPALAQDRAGVAAAVNRNVSGEPPNSALRTIEIGNQVFRNERVTTDASGQAQMLFLDGSALTIGPSANLVLDEFVYDPATGAGRLAVTASQGLMRFVGGKLSKKDAVVLKTPTATVGIRGGIALVDVSASGATQATLLFGNELTVSSDTGALQRITRPGFTTSVASRGAAPSPPARASAEQISQSMDRLSGRSNASGGAREVPTDNRVAQSNVARTNSAAQPPAQVRGPGQPPPPPPPAGGTAGTGSNVATDASQQRLRNVVNQSIPVTSYSTTADPSLGSSLPSVRGAIAGTSSTAQVSTLYIVNGPTGVTTNTKGAQASLVVEGSGPTQRSAIAVQVFDSSGATLVGDLRGSASANSGVGTSRISGTIEARSTSAGGFGGGAYPDSFSYSPLGTGAVDQRGIPPNTTTYTFTQNATRTSNPTAIGTGRSNLLLQGYASGIVDSLHSGGGPKPVSVGNTGGGPGDVQVETNATTSQVGAVFRLDSDYTPGQGAIVRYGRQASGASGRSAYIDNENFAAAEAPNQTLGPGGTLVAPTDGYFVSSSLARVAGVIPAGALCQCEFTKWGFWGGTHTEITTQGQTAISRVHLGTWVAGPLANPAEMPTAGSATYSGHAIGGVLNNGNFYVAGGSFSNQFNFGTRQGTVTIGNFDGMTMTGAVTSSNGRDYGSTLTVSGRTGVTGRVQGSFFAGGGDPARETGGRFSVVTAGHTGTQPPNYSASGIFVGRK